MKQPIVNKKKKALPRIGRATEIVLSQGCLFLFALSMSVLTGLPIYFLRSWLPSLEQPEYILFFSAYLLLIPVAFLGAQHSLSLLKQVEYMGGRRLSFQQRLKKLKRRKKQLNRTPSQNPANREKMGTPAQPYYAPYRKSTFFPTLRIEKGFFKEA